MRYKQGACSIKCELPSSDAVAFKSICPVFVKWSSNPDKHLWSCLFLKAKHGPERKFLDNEFLNMFCSSLLLASACTPQCGYSRGTESPLPVGSCSPGVEGASAKSVFGRNLSLGGFYLWDFPAVPHGIALKLSRLHQQVPLHPAERELQRLG